jgi:hypothetical protein
MRTTIICLTILVLSTLYVVNQLAPSLETIRERRSQLELALRGGR